MLMKNKFLTLLAAGLLAVIITGLLTINRATDAKTVSVGVSTAVENEARTVDIEAALASRALGDDNAPVVIEEFASLSCSHCATFHQTTFPALKEKYIDTGKVRFIYNDFPLNAPALDASLAARCMPESNYFKFISFLFDTQDKWAFEKNYRKILEQNSKLLGLDSKTFNSCLDNQELKMGLIATVQQAQEKYEIKSTPSFIINGEIKLQGTQSIDSLSEKIDALIPASTTAPEEKTEENIKNETESAE